MSGDRNTKGVPLTDYESFEMGKADYSGDGIIHLRELDVYLSERVKTLTNGAQHTTTQKRSSADCRYTI
ncbi:MAG: hypothetical protein IIB41_04100 [Candidatus Marinimicrobia bacterium]|nr:hypothetical protein [Candidatus Neomarinimicrobiota bacterium]